MTEQHGGPLIVGLLRVPYQAAIAYVTAGLAAEFPDLRPAHLTVLQVIEHPPAGSRLTELAELAQITVQSMGELVDGLERGGYVERLPDPADRRAKRIRLTERGWAAHERGGALVREFQAARAERMGGAKMAQLTKLLRELGDSL